MAIEISPMDKQKPTPSDESQKGKDRGNAMQKSALSVALGFNLDLSLADEAWQVAIPALYSLTHKAVLTAYSHAMAPAFGAKASAAFHLVEVSVLLSDDAQIKQLNRDYRGSDKPTNVLSFATLEDAEERRLMEQRGELSLGDIILARQILVREAQEQNKSIEAHYLHLLVHGFLHLLGYDHIEDDQAEEMEKMERQILASLGLEDPYRADDGFD